jgi:hypothetical protein
MKKLISPLSRVQFLRRLSQIIDEELAKDPHLATDTMFKAKLQFSIGLLLVKEQEAA